MLPLPPRSAGQLEAIAGGGVAKLRVREEGADRAVGLTWMPHPPDAIWLAIQDDKHSTMVKGLSELQLDGTRPGFKVLYQHLDLPFPFNDRHWVLHLWNNEALFSAGPWERIWALDPRVEGALVDLPADWRERHEGALWTPVNEGGWWLFPGEGGTLVVYQVRTSIGGAVPEELVLRYAMSTLDEMMAHIDGRAAEIPGHYDAAHFSILRPDGAPIPPWPRADAP